jgi:hypothetical protein
MSALIEALQASPSAGEDFLLAQNSAAALDMHVSHVNESMLILHSIQATHGTLTQLPCIFQAYTAVWVPQLHEVFRVADHQLYPKATVGIVARDALQRQIRRLAPLPQVPDHLNGLIKAQADAMLQSEPPSDCNVSFKIPTHWRVPVYVCEYTKCALWGRQDLLEAALAAPGVDPASLTWRMGWAAGRGGHVQLLAWLRLRGVNIRSAASGAAAGGHLPVFQFLHEHRDEHKQAQIADSSRRADEIGDDSIVEYVTEEMAACPTSPWICSRGIIRTLARFSRISMLEFLVSVGWHIPDKLTEHAVHYGTDSDLRLLKWLESRGASFVSGSRYTNPVNAAVARGKLAIAQWLHERGATVDEQTLEQALLGGNHDCIRWVYDQTGGHEARHFSPYNSVLHNAMKSEDPRVVEFALSELGVAQNESSMWTLYHLGGSTSVTLPYLDYVWENHRTRIQAPKPDANALVNMSISAAGAGRLDIIRWGLHAGAPWQSWKLREAALPHGSYRRPHPPRQSNIIEWFDRAHKTSPRMVDSLHITRAAAALPRLARIEAMRALRGWEVPHKDWPSDFRWKGWDWTEGVGEGTAAEGHAGKSTNDAHVDEED